jgi:mono/diheme cytochrome c family protein
MRLLPGRLATLSTLAAALLAGCSTDSADPLVTRGRQIYLAQCSQCHNADPALAGPVGPPVKGTPADVLEAKVLRGTYPEGYRPKRPTTVMPPQPGLAADLPALAAYLK